MINIKMKEIENDLQCEMKHKFPILMVNLNPNIQSTQRLLCEKCLQYFQSDDKLIGIKKVLQMMEESKKKSSNILQELIKFNTKDIESMQNHIQQLKSRLINVLDQILQYKTEWTRNLKSIGLQYSEYSFLEELDFMILNKQSDIEDQAKISNQITTLNTSWKTKISSKLEIFKPFSEFNSCLEILNNLSQQSTQDYIIQQTHNQNIMSTQSKVIQEIEQKSQYFINQTPPQNLIQDPLLRKEQQNCQQPEKKGLYGFMKK